MSPTRSEVQTKREPTRAAEGFSRNDQQLANLARALGHPARVAIFRKLRRAGACFCGEIVEVMPLAQATVSQHLKVLKEAGLVEGEIEGPRVCYCADEKAVDRLKQLLQDL